MTVDKPRKVIVFDFINGWLKANTSVGFRQFISFGMVGTVGFLVDSCILMILIKFLRLHPISAQVFAFLVAVTVTWYLNRTLTFSSATKRPKVIEWLRYISANGVGALVNFSIYSALVLFAIGLFKQPLIALAISCVSAMLFNFFSSKYFAFKHVNQNLPVSDNV